MTERRRLRDGLRPCLAVFLAARIGLSLVSVIAVGLLEPLDPVDVPGRPGRRRRRAGTTRSTPRAAGRGLVPPPRRPRLVGRRRERRVLPCTAHRPGRVVGPARRRRVAAILVSNLAFLGALLALFALTADAFGERIARPDDRGDGDLPHGVLLPGPLHGVAVPVPVGADVPGRAPRPVGARRRVRRARGAHEERGDPPRAPRGRRRARRRRARWRAPPARPRSRSGRSRGSPGGASSTGTGWPRWTRRRCGGGSCSVGLAGAARWSSRGRSARTGSSISRSWRSRSRARARVPVARIRARLALSLLLPLLDPFPDRPCSRCRGSSWWCSRRCGALRRRLGAEDAAAARHGRARRRLGLCATLFVNWRHLF